jgi:hypothetical protein
LTDVKVEKYEFGEGWPPGFGIAGQCCGPIEDEPAKINEREVKFAREQLVQGTRAYYINRLKAYHEEQMCSLLDNLSEWEYNERYQLDHPDESEDEDLSEDRTDVPPCHPHTDSRKCQAFGCIFGDPPYA